MTIKLSELYTFIEDNNLTKVYGVDIDSFDVSGKYPFQKLSEIGLIAKFDGNGELSDDLLDVAIFAGLDNVNVIIEIPFDQEFDPELVAKRIAGLGCDLSILPPENANPKDPELLNTYASRIMSVASYILDQSEDSYKINGNIHPFYGFLIYMFSNRLNYQPDEITSDEYMGFRFTSGIPPEFIDSLKSLLEREILDFYGGEDNFEKMVDGFVVGLYDQTKDLAEYVVEQRSWSPDLKELKIVQRTL